MRFWLILLALQSSVLSSCSTSTGRSYLLVVRETTRFLESNSQKELLDFKKRQTDAGMEFDFCDGSKWDKGAMVFSTRVSVGLKSKKEGRRSDSKLRAYQQGVFLSGRERDFEEKWRTAILSHLQTIQPDS